MGCLSSKPKPTYTIERNNVDISNNVDQKDSPSRNNSTLQNSELSDCSINTIAGGQTLAARSVTNEVTPQENPPPLELCRTLMNNYLENLEWGPVTFDKDFICVALVPNTTEYNTVQHLFLQTTKKRFCRVDKIERIVNPFLMCLYFLKKKDMLLKYRSVKEEFLFHGTKRQNVDSICKDNFNWRLHGKKTGHKFGKGVSFSPISHYASCYCDKNTPQKVVFAAKVLTSHSCIGKEDMILPPYCGNKKNMLRYDTSIKKGGHVVVKYSDDEFYPAYKVHFTVTSQQYYCKR